MNTLWTTRSQTTIIEDNCNLFSDISMFTCELGPNIKIETQTHRQKSWSHGLPKESFQMKLIVLSKKEGKKIKTVCLFFGLATLSWFIHAIKIETKRNLNNNLKISEQKFVFLLFCGLSFTAFLALFSYQREVHERHGLLSRKSSSLRIYILADHFWTDPFCSQGTQKR